MGSSPTDRKIEEKRGVTVTDSGTPEVSASSLSNGLHSESVQRSTGQTAKSSPAWDEDWGPTTKKTTSSSQSLESNLRSKQPLPSSQPTLGTAASLQFLTPTPSQQTPAACTPVDIEWPPSNSSAGFSTQLGVNEKQNSGSPVTTFDDLDPFANWPPKPSNSASGLGSLTKSRHTDGILSNTSSTGFGSNSNPIGQSNYQGSSISNTNNLSGLGLNSQTRGLLNQRNSGSVVGNSMSTLGTGYYNSSAGQSAGKATGDFGSIFASSNNGQSMPRLAPPPTTAIGRGRGRNQGHSGLPKASRSGQSKVSSDQPPLLDLLQ